MAHPDGRLRGATPPLLLSLATGVSLLALSTVAMAQDVQTTQEPAGAPDMDAMAIQLDEVSILANRGPQSPIQSLGGVSVVGRDEIARYNAGDLEDVLATIPGVSTTSDRDDPGVSISVRGLRDSGRVNVMIDGARQNFGVQGHLDNNLVYVDPALLGGIDVIRGPVANAYGSGAIGGVVAMRTLELEDLLTPSERYAARLGTVYGTNGPDWLGKLEAGVRLTEDADVYGAFVYRDEDDYRDGDGNDVDNTGFDVRSGVLKARLRPADGHEITLSGVIYDNDFVSSTGSGADRDTDVRNATYRLGYTFVSPDTPLVDLNFNLYRNETDYTQIDQNPAAARRDAEVSTTGFDLYNASRFDLGIVPTTLTYGVDYFRDEVETHDNVGSTELFTPSGTREVYGGFIQAKFEYDTWLEVIGGGRFDHFDLTSTATTEENTGDRFSPKLSVGVTPIQGFQIYGTYAEGLRSPTLNEAVVSGLHPAPAAFELLPNAGLSPEVGHTLEAGVNLSYDNVLVGGDGLRAKLAVFRNDVDDYIEYATLDRPGVTNPCLAGRGPICFARLPYDALQYQNIEEARLEGVELEASYDWRWGYVGLAGAIIDGENRRNGDPLNSVYPDKLTTTLGFRALDERLTFGGRWHAVAAKDDVTDPTLASDRYDVFDLFVAYEPNENTRFDASIRNLFDRQYQAYSGFPASETDPAPGFEAMFGVSIKFGVDS